MQTAQEMLCGRPPVREKGRHLYVPSKLCIAKASCFRLFVHCVRRADSRAACTAGKSRAIKMPMMAITTKSSTSVNARRGFETQAMIHNSNQSLEAAAIHGPATEDHVVPTRTSSN